MQVYVFLAEGFEEIEAVTIIDVLRRAQIDTSTMSVSEQIEVTGAHGIAVKADMLFDSEALSNGNMLVLPGGMPGTTNLADHQGLAALLRDYAKRDQWLAAICAAPLVLGRLGLLQGKTATCFPGEEPELRGAACTTDRVVQSGKTITSRSAGTAMEFALKLVEVLKGSALSDELRTRMLVQA